MIITTFEALKSLYPTIVKTIGDVAYDADENIVDYDKDLVNAKSEKMQEAKLTAWQDKDTAKQSALAKLSALGLTQDEISALVG